MLRTCADVQTVMLSNTSLRYDFREIAESKTKLLKNFIAD